MGGGERSKDEQCRRLFPGAADLGALEEIPMWREVWTTMDRLSQRVGDFKPSSGELTKGDAVDGPAAVGVMVLLMVKESIYTRDCGWMYSGEIQSLVKAVDADGGSGVGQEQEQVSRCARLLTMFGMEIDAARGRDWGWMRYPFRPSTRFLESRWRDDVAIACERMGSDRIREAFYLATGGWPKRHGEQALIRSV